MSARMNPVAMRDSRVRFAALALGTAVLVLVWALVGAVRVGEVSAAAPAANVPDSALRFVAPGAGTDIASANARDLFTDDRRPPNRRYLMPGENDAPTGGPPPLPTVLGTSISTPDESFAIVQLPGTSSTIIRVGAKIGGYTVVSIDRSKVVFRSAEGIRFTVDASKP